MYFSTQGLDRTIRRAAWSAAIRGQCGSFITDFGRAEFEGTIDMRRVGGFDCVRISQTSREALRTWLEIAAGAPNVYFVILQMSGQCRMEQAGREVVLAPGDITIIDSALPCRFRFCGKNVQLCLHVPRLVLEETRVNWARQVATLLRGARSSILGAVMRAAFEQVCEADAQLSASVADAMIALLGAGWDQTFSLPDHADAPDSAELLLQSIQDFVIGNLADETLSPRRIAQAHRISERQLHRIFQKSGLTVCRWIRQARLDRCVADLRDRTQRPRTITDIAFSWGFNDAAHFSRLFHAEFGQAPSAYRETVLNPGVAAQVN